MTRWEPEDWIMLACVVGFFAFWIILTVCVALTS